MGEDEGCEPSTKVFDDPGGGAEAWQVAQRGLEGRDWSLAA